MNHISAMVAYWNAKEICVFAYSAYLEWFGRSSEEMEGISMKNLLGSLYEQNLPYIRGALAGQRQVFERQIPLPNGEFRESIATYTPDIVDGTVCGFTAHVADVTAMKQREAILIRTVKERDEALAEVRTLRGLLPICAGCKNIRDAQGNWYSVEQYVSERTQATFSHGLCPTCLKKYYPDVQL
ncbi:MAG: PAS domain-containing protein [Opitutus sp.]